MGPSLNNSDTLERVEARASGRRRLLDRTHVLVIIAVMVAYANSLWGPFVLDDVGSIANNDSIRHLCRIGAVLQPPAGQTVEGRPVLNLSLALTYAISGLDVRGYHLVNVLIHLAAAVTLFALVRRTLSLPACGPFRPGQARGLALAVALIWALHPLQTSAVTYIIQRAESLMGLLFLLTLYCITRGARSDRPLAWWLAAVAACALGMGTKEVMAAAPVIALVYDRVFLSGSWKATFRQRWGLHAALAACWGLLAMTIGHRGGTAGFLLPVHPVMYGATQLGVIVHYVRLAFWPHPLVFDYAWPIARSAWEVVPGAIAIAALLGATIWALIRRPTWGFLGLWFLAILAPTSSIVPIRDVAFEHRMYLPLAAVVSGVVIGSYHLWRNVVMKKMGWASAAAGLVGPLALVGVLAAGLGWMTFQRNADYRTAVGLWRDTLEHRPDNPRAHSNLGMRLARAGKLEEGLRHIDRAIELDPEYGCAYGNRAAIYLLLGKRRRALRDADKAVALEPEMHGQFYNRARIHQELNNHELAVRDLTRVIDLAPDRARAFRDRGLSYVHLGRDERAAADFSEALRLRPDWPQPYLDLAWCDYRLGRYEQAWADLERYEQLGQVAPHSLVRKLRQADPDSGRP